VFDKGTLEGGQFKARTEERCCAMSSFWLDTFALAASPVVGTNID
jgi:hypothetical protein